jgi:hypothetical protein
MSDAPRRFSLTRDDLLRIYRAQAEVQLTRLIEEAEGSVRAAAAYGHYVDIEMPSPELTQPFIERVHQPSNGILAGLAPRHKDVVRISWWPEPTPAPAPKKTKTEAKQ